MSQQPPDFEGPQQPGRPDEPPATPKGRRHSSLIVFAIAGFVIVSLATSIYLVLVVVTQIDDRLLPGNELKTGILAEILPGVDSGKTPEAADIDERINILVLGLDRLTDEPSELPTRTDTVFILTIDPFSKTAGVLSIPRDLLVELPDGQGGYFEDRVNVAYVYGETQIEYPGGGPGLAMDTMERNFGIPIDHYLILDFNDFIALIDEIGGVEIDVTKYVADFRYRECKSGCPIVSYEFLPGPQHMDGQAALAYARIREGSSDLDRIERQQLVMQAATEKAIALDLFDVLKARSLYNKFKDAVDTDISDFQIPGLAILAKDIGTERLRMVSLNTAVSNTITESGAAVLIPDWSKVEALKRQVFSRRASSGGGGPHSGAERQR